MLIVPDVHGREFWKKPLEENPEEEVVFLGDYLDPYPAEGITGEKALEVFKEILSLPEDRVTLLLGNHDFGYLDPVHRQNICRHDWGRDQEIESLFRGCLDRFKIGVVKEGVIFTHAGVHPGWIKRHPEYGEDPREVISYLDSHLWEPDVLDSLLEYSSYRGGWGYRYGSPIWSDIREWGKKEGSTLQIVGHTQLKEGCIVELPGIKCIDCKHVCRYNKNNKIEIL